MKQIVTNQTVKIPEGLTVTVKSRMVTVKGPRGILKRSFKHLALDIRVSKLIILNNCNTKMSNSILYLMILGFPFIFLINDKSISDQYSILNKLFYNLISFVSVCNYFFCR